MPTERSTERCDIAVFARAPVAGRTKTRLVPMLGEVRAAALHRALLWKTLHCAAEACAMDAGLGRIRLCCTPDIGHPEFGSCAAEFGVALEAQSDGDLGERMLTAFATSASPLILVGTDCPVLTPQLLSRCAHELRQGRDAVFLPAEDGGYALVGLRRAVPTVFQGMQWSAAEVMEETRARLRCEGLSWSEPAIVWDVDRPQDVIRLIASGLLPEWQPIEETQGAHTNAQVSSQ